MQHFSPLYPLLMGQGVIFRPVVISIYGDFQISQGIHRRAGHERYIEIFILFIIIWSPISVRHNPFILLSRLLPVNPISIRMVLPPILHAICCNTRAYRKGLSYTITQHSRLEPKGRCPAKKLILTSRSLRNRINCLSFILSAMLKQGLSVLPHSSNPASVSGHHKTLNSSVCNCAISKNAKVLPGSKHLQQQATKPLMGWLSGPT